MKKPAPTTAAGQQTENTDPILMTDPDEALRFLALLGKDPATTYFRTIRHGVGANKSRKGRDLIGFDAAALKADNDAGDSIYLVVGNATEASGKNKKGKPTGAVIDTDITSCPALFVEWDHRPKAEQLAAWQELQLPEPTAMLDSGGKSVHCYWRLTDPITPEQWRKATAQLIAHCNSDPTCSNPSRVMRLPGFRHWDKQTGKATGTSAALLSTSDKSYTLQQLLACMPDPQQELTASPSPAAPQARTYPPRPLEQVREALQFIPEILPDTKQRDTFLKLAWGLLGAVREAGESDPMALALLEEHSPQVLDVAEYLKTEPTEITAKTFWRMAREAGWRPASSSTANVDQVVANFPDHGDNSQQQGQKQTPPTPRVLTTEQVKDRLHEAHRAGMGGTELELLITELATASDLHPLRLSAISNAVALEVEREAALDRETLALLTEADRQEIAAGITLDTLLPAPLAAQIRVRIEDMPYDDLVAALTFLTTMAGLTKLGTTVNGNPATRFIVPTNLFLANVADSGRKKTPLTNTMVSEPIAQIRLELAQQHARALQQWEEDARGVKKDERPEKPRPAYALVNDYTGEAFAALLQEHESRGLAVLVMRDELAGLFGALDAYRGGRGSDEQQLLELFDGGNHTSIRVRGDRAYERSHVAILGNIQPAVLKGLVAGTDPSGKWARFLFCRLPDTIAPLPLEVSVEREQATDKAVAFLQKVAKAVYCLPPIQYRLEASALAWFSRFELQQQEHNHAAELDTIRALYGKAAGKVLRVAGLLHILERVCDTAMVDPGTIRLSTLQKAILLVDTLNQWAINFHSEAAAEVVGGIDNLMRRVHNASAGAGKRWIGWRDFSRKLSSAQRAAITRQAFEQVVDRLAAVSAPAADKSRQADTDEPFSGVRWGESRRNERGMAEYRAIHGSI